MPPAVGTNRARDGLPGDDLPIFGVAVIVFVHCDRECEDYTRRNKVCIDFDLGSRITFPQLVQHLIDVGTQSLVRLPRDSSSNDEVALRSPEIGSHTQ